MLRRFECILALLGLIACLPSTPANAARTVRTHEYGFTYSYFDYAESLPSPFKSTEKGWIPGFRFTTENRTGNTRQRLMAQIGIGHTDYDGSLQNGMPYKTTTENTFFTAQVDTGRLRAGRRQAFGVLPYVGLGLKAWVRDSSDDPHGYLERYGWVYIPAGVTAQLQNSKRVSVAVDASVRQVIYGWISVANAASGKLGAKRGYRIEVPITLHLANQRDFRIRPWYDYSESGRGNVSYQGLLVGYEPESLTRQYGADLSMDFRF